MRRFLTIISCLKRYPRQHFFHIFASEEIFDQGPKCRGRAKEKLKRTREARRMNKKPKKSPTQSRTHARSLKMARPCPPFLNMEVSVGGTPAPPDFVTPKTRTSRARTATAELA
ncbi:hypothetical protein PIB30_062597 [Stylosanthes scabra]|uniref:Uncharacterized protein n=1 Tax=Stylosanthes scabra TaxID=79078 RepID=A0ABU6WKS6_9FABA|nr:hypothetical protein [Stylosanthes scabra]